MVATISGTGFSSGTRLPDAAIARNPTAYLNTPANNRGRSSAGVVQMHGYGKYETSPCRHNFLRPKAKDQERPFMSVPDCLLSLLLANLRVKPCQASKDYDADASGPPEHQPHVFQSPPKASPKPKTKTPSLPRVQFIPSP